MLDNVRLKLRFKPPDCFCFDSNFTPISWHGIAYTPVLVHGQPAVRFYIGTIKNIRIRIFRQYALLENSIHKYYLDHNGGDFYISDAYEALIRLSQVTGIDWLSATPTRVEYGCNIRGVNTASIIDSFIGAKTKLFLPIARKGIMVGKKCEFEGYYTLKIYNKTLELKDNESLKLDYDLVRWEVVAERRHLQRILGGEIPTVKELFNPGNDYLEMLKSDCLTQFNRTVRVVNNINLNRLSLSDKLILAYHKDPTILADIQQHHKEKYRKDKIRYQQLISQHQDDSGPDFGELIKLKVVELNSIVPSL